MEKILFFDTEIQPESGKLLDIGAVRTDGMQLHTASAAALSDFQRDILSSADTTSSPMTCALSTTPSPTSIWPSTPSACRRCSFPCGPITPW